MRIGILGMGGVGATVAGALAAWEKDLVFFARGKTKKVLEEKGLHFQSEELGDLWIHPSQVSDNPQEIGVLDVLFICSKSYGLKEACKAYRFVVGENTLVIPLQNGVTAAEEITEYFEGQGKIAHGYIYCLSNIQEPGYIINFGKLLRIGFGFPHGQKNERAEELAAMLQKGGLPVYYGKEILTAIWEKYAMMCGNSCAFIHFDSAAGPIQSDTKKLDFLTGVYQDITRLALGLGVKIEEGLPGKYRQEFLSVPPQTTSSLYRDMRDKKTETEFEFLVGNGCRLAQKEGISVPFMQQVYDEVTK